MQYKQVKNINRPGRPPAGQEWVKDETGAIVTNKQGEFAYQPASEKTAAKKKSAKKAAGKTKSAAKKAGRKAVEITGEMQSALLLKKTYTGLSSEALVKIRDIADSLIEKAKDAEKTTLEKAIQKLQSKLEKL